MTSLRTCAECNNILYPREDPDNKRLLYACRHCDYSEIASQALVYRNDLQKSAQETAGVTTDVASDPTLVIHLPIPFDYPFAHCYCYLIFKGVDE